MSVYSHNSGVGIKGDFDGKIEFDRISKLPKKVHYTLKMDVENKALKVSGSMMVEDSYTADFVLNKG